jgi:hypothetical protein
VAIDVCYSDYPETRYRPWQPRRYVVSVKVPANRFVFVLAALSLFTGARASAQFETRDAVAPGFAPGSVVAGDFNHDGNPDFAVAGVGGGPLEVQVYLGNGDGTFAPPVAYDIGSAVAPIVAGDVNNDGNVDLVVANLTNSVDVLFGNGDGTFQGPVNYPVAGAVAGLALGDFNGTDNLDIISTDGDINSTTDCECVAVLLGNGDGTFQEPPIVTYPPEGGIEAVAAGYFNSDKKLDVAITLEHVSSDTLQIMLGNGDGTFSLGASYVVGPSSLSVIAADFRRNGKTDLAVGQFGGPGVAVLLGNGNGTFQKPVSYNAGSPLGVASGDVNGDGIPDLITASASGINSGAAFVLLGKGNGTFEPATSYPAGEFPAAVALADFNNDRKLDITVADQGGDLEYVLLNTGVARFSPTTPLTFPTQLLDTTSAPISATMTNNGTSPLRISSVSFSGPPFEGETTCKGSLSAGADCTITARFTPQAQGPLSGTVTIKDSASSKPEVVELEGVGTVMKFSPSMLKFGTQEVGTSSAPRNIELTNVGNTTILLTGLLWIGGTDYSDFTQTNNCPTSIDAGASCEITLIFTPKKAGTRTATLNVPDTAGGSPQVAPLSGTGD